MSEPAGALLAVRDLHRQLPPGPQRVPQATEQMGMVGDPVERRVAEHDVEPAGRVQRRYLPQRWLSGPPIARIARCGASGPLSST